MDEFVEVSDFSEMHSSCSYFCLYLPFIMIGFLFVFGSPVSATAQPELADVKMPKEKKENPKVLCKSE